MKLDNIDNDILNLLEKDSRTSLTVISRILNVPRTTVKSRIDRMAEAGLIVGFTVKMDHSKLGMPTTAFVLISYDPSSKVSENEVANALFQIENVEEVHIISGEYDIIAKIRGKSIEDVGDAVVDRMHKIKGIAKTLTITSFREIKHI